MACGLSRAFCSEATGTLKMLKKNALRQVLILHLQASSAKAPRTLLEALCQWQPLPKPELVQRCFRCLNLTRPIQ